MTISGKINLLIENVKYKEAIVLLKNSCVGALSVFKPRVIILSSELNKYKQDEVNLVEDVKDLNKIRLEIITLSQQMDVHHIELDTENINELLACSLLIEDSFPFIDRTKFRDKIKNALASNKADVILVNGEPRSGMSYLEKFLRNISTSLDILTFVPIEIPAVLGDPDIILGEKLAKSILNEIGLEIEFDTEENEQFKFKQFINKLKKCVKEENKVPVFFLHDFHKIEDNNDNLLEFIFTLIKSIKNDFPKCIFIIAGFNYQNIRHWHSDLKFTTPVYNIEKIQVDDVKKCLSKIYLKYETKIHAIDGFDNITLDEYIDGMISMLIEDSNKIDISAIGLGISEHLLALKE
ncbi:hypothetical protein [Lutibacter citreus]|uniref:hypothetical protein n=1 Tax=Lutibacter citreus TaxID=2138210 RepID=UPI000DBE8755|nr:hypothetical protein [Lutibacter citreus]